MTVNDFPTGTRVRVTGYNPAIDGKLGTVTDRHAGARHGFVDVRLDDETIHAASRYASWLFTPAELEKVETT